MSEGLVTFFHYKEFGFYKRGSDYHEDLDMGQMLDSLEAWYNSRSVLADTLPWDEQTPGYEFRKKVYLKSIKKNELTGDFLVTLWRSVGDGSGVYGIRSDMAPLDAEVLNAENAETEQAVIWGEPAYYWFIPSLSLFASIKFSKSIADTELLNRYLRCFIELQSTVREKVTEEYESSHGTMQTRVYFKSQDGDETNLWLRIASEQYVKLTDQADLRQIASEITHFVKREVISASVTPTQDWTRFFGRLPFVSNEMTRNSRQIQIVIDASPTPNELREIFNAYNQNYNRNSTDTWSNLGFKKDGISGGVFWLDQFVVKSHLAVAQSGDSGYYTPEVLFNALQFRRDLLLAPFRTLDSEDTLVNG